jgi:hypothetical protein
MKFMQLGTKIFRVFFFPFWQCHIQNNFRVFPQVNEKCCNGPVMVRVSGKYMSEIVVKLDVAEKVVCELTRWVGEK